MKTSFYPFLLVVVLFLCNSTRSMAQQNVSTSPEIQIFYSGGSGTVGDPYKIANLTDLRYLSEHSADWNKYFIQTANIDATATNTWNVGNHDNDAGTATVAMGFSPIGNSTTSFSGKYDGQSYTISGLYINRPLSDNIGLFGYITYDIRNLGLLNLTYTGMQYVGGLVGTASSGTITNTYSKGAIVVDSRGNSSAAFGGLVGMTFLACTISNSYSEANVSGTRNCAGGLVGINWGTVTKCYATGSVSGVGSNRGGLVGENGGVPNGGIIIESYATGNVNGNTTAGEYFGGLVGRNNNGTINNSYSTGNVTGYNYVGGLVGYIHLSTSSISNSYSTGTVTTPTFERGGLIGANYFGATLTNCYWNTQTSGIAISGSGGTGKTTAEMKTQATFIGWDFVTTPVWKINSNNNGYPYLGWQTYPSPEIDVKRGTTPIADGTGSYDFGSQNNATNTDIVFTIENNGAATSSLGSFSITGTNADQFSLQGTNPTTVSNAGTTTFTVRFSPTSAGSKTATVSFANQDANENPYNFTITGTGVAPVVIFSGGAGTLASPYQIATLADLRFLSENTSYWAAGKYYIQTADIDATATNTWNSNGSGGYLGFSPIGTGSISFEGNYDGQGHTISNLYINRLTTDFVGLFGTIVNRSVGISNLGLINVNITGQYCVGGMIGYGSMGTFSNLNTTGTVVSSQTGNTNAWAGGLIGLTGLYTTTSSSYSGASVTVNGIGQTVMAAGLIGRNDGTINNCYATGNVSGNGSYRGGLVGDNHGNISKSFATGNVNGSITAGEYFGGLVGISQLANISNCYSTGNVTGYSKVGGLVGAFNVSSGSYGITNSYATGAVTCINLYRGGLIGLNSYGFVSNCFWDTQTTGEITTSGDGTGKTSAQLKTQSTFAGWDFVTTPVWKINSNNNGYPYLGWQTYSIIAPTLQASALVFTSVTNYGMTIGWTTGNGAARTVFVKEGTGVSQNPVNQTTYIASSDWVTKGTQLAASGYYCVYNGSGNSVSISNLTKNTTYSVQVVEYNGGAGAEVYCTTTGANNPLSQTTANESGTDFNSNNASKLMVYPNPAQDKVTLQLGESNKGNVQVYVFDLSGKMQLAQKLIFNDNNSMSLNLSELKRGYYQLQIIGTQKTETLRLLKE